MDRTTTPFRTGLLATLLLAGTVTIAQTARVQVIHNCADAAAAVVDVYLDNTLLLDDFAFRTASPFVDAPAGVSFTVGIAPSTSTSSGDAIYTENFTLATNETYVIVASGIISGSGYVPAPGFSLEVFAMGRESASTMGNTDVLVFHGSTDAPTVDVYESAQLDVTAVDDISYAGYSPDYLELPTNDYVVEVRTSDNSAIVAAYSAPLQTLGLQDAALVVVASGFLDPSQNSNGPAFGLWAALPSGGPLVELPAAPIPTARVQVVHNSADAAAATVDVWLNSTLLLDDFAFRTASPFVDAQAGVDLTVGIAPANSTQPSDAIAQFNYNLMEDETYVIVANGIVSTTGYTPNVPFDLYVQAGAREIAMNAANTDVLVFHGSTDAPTVDVHEQDAGELADDLVYGTFAGFLELATADYTLQVRNEQNSTIVAAYDAPLSTLGLQGQALTVLASGFLDPAQNSNGEAFGLWAALASGGPLVELPAAAIPTTRVQVVHNSADAAAATVDVWLNDAPLLDDFAFRTASPFVDVQAGVPFDVTIAGAGSTDTTSAVARFTYELDADETYILVANGIVSGSGYMPVQPFDIHVFAGAREAATSGGGNTDILVFHGSTDAPTVDVVETAVLGGATLVNGMSYGEFGGNAYLEPPTNDYTLEIQAGGSPVVAYDAPLATLGLQGEAITVLASGFLDPSMNSNGPAFGLWVALAAGGPLVELPISTSVNELDRLTGFTAWPNPANDVLYVDLSTREGLQASMVLTDMTGRTVRRTDGSDLAAGESRLVMDLQGLSEGLYQLSIIGSNVIRTAQVQVMR